MNGKPITRRAVLISAGIGAGATALAAALGGCGGEEKRGKRMTAFYRRGDLPTEDPASPAWAEIPATDVALQPQKLAPPYLDEGAIDSLDARALHNGEQIVFRLAWEDPDRDDLDGVARFRDAVAVQLPTALGPTPPPIMMGGPDVPVHILQWRATWQRDIVRRAGVQDLYPHAVRDVSPDEVLPPFVSVLYYAGRAAGNPLSALQRLSPIEEIVAEGFGTATTLPTQQARGFGVHDGEGWTVTVGLPLDRGLAGARLEPGSAWPVAFAVWLGSKRNRGSRKHFADWVECRLQPV